MLLLESVTVAPPEGADPLRVTVRVALEPPATLAELMAIADRETAPRARASHWRTCLRCYKWP